jgi:hypothetical protein
MNTHTHTLLLIYVTIYPYMYVCMCPLRLNVLGLPDNWFSRVGSVTCRFYCLETSPKCSSLERFNTVCMYVCFPLFHFGDNFGDILNILAVFEEAKNIPKYVYLFIFVKK